MIDKDDSRHLQKFAEKLALEAGKILLKEQDRVAIVKYKDSQDIATSADLASEKYIIDSILAKYPNHGIISEERGEINEDSKYRWVIDPLDGTKDFIRNIPLYNVSIALELEGELIVGVVHNPADKSLYSAAKDVGSYLNGKRIKVSEKKKLNESFVCCYLPSFGRNKEKYEQSWQILSEIGKHVYRMRSLAAGNLALCWLAHGGFEAYINISNPPKWHDLAPGLLIAKEAGAIATDLQGKEIKSEADIKSIVVANNTIVHSELLDLTPISEIY